jgi:hypothetical protein
MHAGTTTDRSRGGVLDRPDEIASAVIERRALEAPSRPCCGTVRVARSRTLLVALVEASDGSLRTVGAGWAFGPHISTTSIALWRLARSGARCAVGSA